MRPQPQSVTIGCSVLLLSKLEAALCGLFLDLAMPGSESQDRVSDCRCLIAPRAASRISGLLCSQSAAICGPARPNRRNGLKTGVSMLGGTAPVNVDVAEIFPFSLPASATKNSKLRSKNTNKKSGSLRLKSEISFLPTRAAKTRTGVAVHENLLDSVMAAPLKRE